MATKKAQRNQDTLIVAVITLASVLWILAFHVFGSQLHSTVKTSGTRYVGLIFFLAAVAWLWIGYKKDAEGKSYLWVWGIGMLLGSLLSYGFANM
jgi:hypothetical protein